MSFPKIGFILQRCPGNANIFPPVPPYPAGRNLRTMMRKIEIISISEQPDLNVITDKALILASQ